MSIINIKVKRKRSLSKYLKKKMESGDKINTTFHLIKVPTENELEFWIQQYKIKSGHTVWSEKFQRNIWIEDESSSI